MLQKLLVNLLFGMEADARFIEEKVTVKAWKVESVGRKNDEKFAKERRANCEVSLKF